MALTEEDKKRIEAEERYRADIRAQTVIPPKKTSIIGKFFKFLIVCFLILVCLIFIITMIGSNSSKGKPTEATSSNSSNSSASAKPSLTYLDLSCSEFCNIFNNSSKLSELQKDEEFKKYSGQYVRWNGKVSSIDTFLGTLKVQVKCHPNTLISDLIISFDDDQKEILLGYAKGDKISFEAKLDRYGAIIGHSLSEGRIIK